VLLCSIALLIALAAPGQARQTQAALDSIDSLVSRGNAAEARTRLERWWRSAEGARAPSQPLLARALFLRARLATDPRAAVDDYLTLALAHPTAPEAPAALLNLGQGLHATGDHQRAAAYLERLARDYPTTPLRPLALLWLARVNLAAERPGAACAAARQGTPNTRDPELLALLKAEEADACGAAARGTADKAFVTTTRADGPPAASPPAPSPPAGNAPAPSVSRRYTLQAGAFRESRGAATLAARLRQAGFETRTVTIPGNSLYRVRVGTFQTAAEAESMARRVRAAGFDVVVTADAATEKPAS
jgi:cell division septation protein DedD